MANLKIVDVQIVDTTNIEVLFTDKLVNNLNKENINIFADTPNVPDCQVLSVKIIDNKFIINCLPLSPLAAYFLVFKSTDLRPFISLHGESRLSEDNINNKYLILGPLDPDNPVKNYLSSYLNGNIYDVDNDNTIINKYVKSLSIAMSRALYDIRQVKNENYLSFTVSDEKKVRGRGAFDRLNEEGAYEVIRVGRGPTSAKVDGVKNIEEFSTFPITLQQASYSELLTPNSTNNIGYFNINNLILNLKQSPAIKLTKVTFIFNDATPNLSYDIAKYGYQIKNSRYDQNYAFTYLQLGDNQIKLNDTLLQDSNFHLNNISVVQVSYEYKDLGLLIDANTLKVTSIQDSTREVLPPISNIFNLKYSPIVDINGNVPSLNGVIFTDPNAINNSKHPAFKNEIPFRLNALPSIPGQYSIDYNTGTVYVYGENLNNDGTGPFPPVATYQYELTYNSELDYVYDETLLDLVALPLGNLINNSGSIKYKFEQIFVPNVDYKIKLHNEELSERIGNNILAVNVLRVKNAPITNVFRIFNETSGEIYTLNRWNDDKIYFRYNTPPNIIDQNYEKVSFKQINNELLFVNTTLTNSLSLRIFKVLLNNNNIINSNEDALGASFNTSLSFSESIFSKEKWFNRNLELTQNLDNLVSVGHYIVDYQNGIIYVAVDVSQNYNLGTASYKFNDVSPQYPHLISVNDIYYQKDFLSPKNKTFEYSSFDDGSIIINNLDHTDELLLNNNPLAIYQLNNKKVGIFYNSSFISGVTNQIVFPRYVFEYTDLVNSTNPINFALSSKNNGFELSVSSINKEVFDTVNYNNTDGYFILINENIPYLSPNITFDFTVTRIFDNANLWDNSGIIVPGEILKLKLSGVNSPQVGDVVKINYVFTLNNLSRVVLDYNKGDLYTDYTYLADEIIVSYEYGDNVIDFRESKSISENTEYYVSYKAGALRDALLKNFGTLVNIPELTNFDIDFNRERYREALMAALSSFIQGPTVAAIKNIGKTISHIEPEVIEAIFNGWSLGNSLLYPQSINTTGSFEFLPSKYDNGVLINQSNQSISFPSSNNLRLEEGTFECWVSPQWNGIDNDANLTFSITRDGYDIKPSQVFIGSGEVHPEITNNQFSINKSLFTLGVPNLNKDGVFIYYDFDSSKQFYRWYVNVIDGYVNVGNHSYKIKIQTNGTLYDNKKLVDGYQTLITPAGYTLFTGNNFINLNITSNVAFNKGITFVSDIEHYLLDMGEHKSKNRISIYKDVSGYFNFRIFDKKGSTYSISANVSNWKSGELHHVATSWKLNTKNNRDEMHLFIDGIEVPNIIKYGQKNSSYLHEKFRTINTEEIVGLANYDIVGSTDLKTIVGSATVTSSINFSALNIVNGNKIYIDDNNFNDNGYTILSVSGQTLILNSAMPVTLNNLKFSVNRSVFSVNTDVNAASNLAISTVHSILSGNDLSGSIGSNVVTSSVNFEANNVLPGFLIRINNVSLPLVLTIDNVLGNSLILTDNLTVNLSSEDFWIYSNQENEIPGMRALNSSYSVSKDGYGKDQLIISNAVYANDLILIRTLGLNFNRIKRQYYVWSDSFENFIMTKLPPPISLDSVMVTKVILPSTIINSNNSTNNSGILTSNNISTYQPSNAQIGRTLTINLSGNNVDFSSQVQVIINGVVGSVNITENLFCNDYGDFNTVNKFVSINYISVIVKPLNINKNAVTISIKEKYPITIAEGSPFVPIIKYSYYVNGGYSLQSDGYGQVKDENNTFSQSNVGNYLIINSPISIAGYYKITAVSLDRKTLTIEPTVASFPLPLTNFVDGTYQILNTTDYRSGLQGGFFNFEVSLLPSQGYMLRSGLYELEYATYTQIKLDPVDYPIFIGSNFDKNHQLNGIVSNIKIYSNNLTDTRIGESIPSTQRSITKDFNSVKPLLKDSNTLFLSYLNQFPFTNLSDYYINSSGKEFFQSSLVVNDNFKNSLVILDKPVIISNEGILDTRKEGSIEFWINPIYDTGNDPNDRYYFDAFSAITEEVTSINSTTLKLSGSASKVLNVFLSNGNTNVDYFAGGSIELDTKNAIQDNVTSNSNSTIVTNKPILQVISVKIVNDFSNTDYFAGGSIGSDKKTIYLGKLLPSNNIDVIVTYTPIGNSNDTINGQVIRLNKKLPYQNTPVKVSYLPKGIQGDRISIFKDKLGFIVFEINASGEQFSVRAQTRWVNNSWHRIKATYKLNGGLGKDEMRLFLDGYECINPIFGVTSVYNVFPTVSDPEDGYFLTVNMKFKDPINELFIGSDYLHSNPMFSIIDNLRISNISRPIYAPYGESIDVNYNSNLKNVFPVTEDLYTTYLLDFNKLIQKNNDFSILQNRNTGLFDFSVNIFDSLGIVESSIKAKESLEKLINVLKPANSQAYINYLK